MKKGFSLRVVLIASLTALLSGSALAQDYARELLDPQYAAEVKARELLGKLTLEEKAALVQNHSIAIPRLGIPSYDWWNEALHGVGRNGSATVFPQPIGMAASFDEPLVYKVFSAVSDEARVKHRMARESGEVKQYQGLTFWTPNINIFRDPRWGRGMETYGEDPWLTGWLGMAVVRGLQGPESSPVLKAHACAKHYAVHSGLEKNRHRFNAEVSERDLRETYLPAFKDLVTKAKVREVMTAYNSFRGYPCGASEYLVEKILRGEWGYEGMIVSDCWAIPDFFENGRHGFVDNAVLAAAAAVRNGVDVECGETYVNIPEAVEMGVLDEKYLDRNLLRALTERFRLGEIDRRPSPWDDLPNDIVEGPEHRALSLRMAQESLVLLQNRGGILPLSPAARIAVVGPNADDREMMWGNYNAVPRGTVTLLDALRADIPGIKYIRGCGILDESYMQESIRDIFLPKADIPSLLDELKDIDIVIFAGGISPVIEGEEMPVQVPGFSGGDRTDIELPGVQREVLKALHDAGKKVVLVNFSGSAMGLVPETQSCDAILQAWYPGQEGGTAIADVLFGRVNPSGKLPVTFYASVDDLPPVEDYNMEGHTYRYFRGKPLYPFGFGLSYTTFRFDRPRISGGKIEFTLRNTGRVDGTETVQVYVSKPGDTAGPVRTLRAARRVYVPARGKVKVSIPLTREMFEWWDESAQNMIIPSSGEYILCVGSSSDTKDLKTVRYIF